MIGKLKELFNSRVGIILRWILFLPISLSLSLLFFFLTREITIILNLSDKYDLALGLLLVIVFLGIFVYFAYQIIPFRKWTLILSIFSITILYIIFINWETGVVIQNPSLFSPGRVELRHMEKLKKSSSFIDEVYFSVNSGYLIVEIEDKYYEYCDFNNYKWNDLKKTDSLGRSYNREIKGKYSCSEYFKEGYIDIWGKDEGYYEVTGEPYPL